MAAYRLLLGVLCCQVFAMGGRMALTKRVYPSPGCDGVELFFEAPTDSGLDDGEGQEEVPALAADLLVRQVAVARPQSAAELRALL